MGRDGGDHRGRSARGAGGTCKGHEFQLRECKSLVLISSGPDRGGPRGMRRPNTLRENRRRKKAAATRRIRRRSRRLIRKSRDGLAVLESELRTKAGVKRYSCVNIAIGVFRTRRQGRWTRPPSQGSLFSQRAVEGRRRKLLDTLVTVTCRRARPRVSFRSAISFVGVRRPLSFLSLR